MIQLIEWFNFCQFPGFNLLCRLDDSQIKAIFGYTKYDDGEENGDRF
jgi:hypothetical protein